MLDTDTSAQTAETSTPSIGEEAKVFDTQAVETPTETTEAPASWMWGDDITGTGDKPEWFKDSKYKSVSEQAKAYTELEKRLGGFVGAPKEGYQLNEELGINSDDPSIKAVLDVLGKSNASNEVANELISSYVQAQQAQEEGRRAKELELLGTNADYRINAIKEFATSAIPSHLQDTFNGMVTSAAGIEVVEALMKKMQGSVVAPDGTTSAVKMDSDKLREMMFAKNDNGQLKSSIDPEYKKMVDKAYRDFYGS